MPVVWVSFHNGSEQHHRGICSGRGWATDTDNGVLLWRDIRTTDGHFRQTLESGKCIGSVIFIVQQLNGLPKEQSVAMTNMIALRYLYFVT